MPEIIKIDNPFRRSQREHIQAVVGETVEQICERETKDNIRFDCDYVTAINGVIIEESERASRKLKEDEFLLIVPKVGGDDGKSVLNMLAMIAVMWASGGLAGPLAITFGMASAVGYTIFYVALMMAGGMMISALQPHPKKPSSGFVDSEQSQSFGWNPATVQKQGIAIPRFYGLNKMFGNVIAAHTEKETVTFSETTIADTYYYFRTRRYGDPARTELIKFDPRKVNLYALFCLGMGPMREPVVEGSLKLNDQLVANLNSVYYEERRGNISQQVVSFFDKTKLEVVVGRLVVNGTPITYTTTNANFNDLEIELAFPKGLYDASGGDLANYTVNVTVEIKKTTSSTWTLLADGVNIIDNVGDKVIETYTTVAIFAVEYGSNYDIRVTKNTAERDDIKYGDDLVLDKVREIIDRQFIYPRSALVGVKALATDQLSGSIRFSCYSRGLYVRRYSGSNGGTIGYTSNPGDVIADILTQPVYTGEHSPWDDLKLLLNFEGADAATSTVDDSPRGHSITFGGGAELDTAEFKFGAASLLLDGVDSYLQITNDRSSFGIWENLVEDWTVDIELKLNDHAGTDVIFGQYIDANNQWHLAHVHGAGLGLKVKVGGVDIIDITAVGEIADNNFHHLAICKVGDEVGLYKNDTLIAYVQIASTDGYVFREKDVFLGQDGNGANFVSANIDHFRFHKFNVFSAAPDAGLADTITEPTAAYTDPGNSYAVARYDGYNPSKLLTADFEDLADWCDDAETNPVNYSIDSISLATQAVVVTRNKNNLKVGDTILFRNVDDNGMTEIADETTATILKVTDNTTFTIDLDTSGYTAFEIKTRLLLNFEENNQDASIQGHPIYKAAGMDSTTDAAKWGSKSYEYDGDQNRLYTPDSADWDFIKSLTDSWTFEAQVKFRTHAGTDYLFDLIEDGTNFYVLKHVHGSGWSFNSESGGVAKVDTGFGGEIADTNWHWLMVAKIDDDIGIYVDGAIVAYDLIVGGDLDDFIANFDIGGIGTVTTAIDGYIDAVRVYKGNPYGAAPDVLLADSVTPPTVAPDANVPTIEEYQPRFAFNGGFDAETNMWEAALRVCELCRCVPFWDGDTIRLAIDKAATSVYAFTMGNIIKDSYREKYIPTAERAAEIEIHYRDASQDYERQPFSLVKDSIGNPSNKIRLDLFGITDTDMANRLADFKLLQNLNIKTIAIWTSEIDAIACTIGDVVDVQHDVTNYGSIGSGDDAYTGGGRIISARREVTEELITNGNFLNWTGGTPDDWTVSGEVGNDPEVSEVGTGQGHGGSGSGMCNIYTSGVYTSVKQTITAVEEVRYVVTLTINKVVAAGVRIMISQAPDSVSSDELATEGVHTFSFIAKNTTPGIYIARDGATDVTISNLSVKEAVPTALNSDDTITIDGDIYFDDADWQGGSTAYKLLVKTADDSAPESKTIIGVTKSSVIGGTFDITVSGAFTSTPQRDDVWAAGVSAYETRPTRIVNMRQNSDQQVEITAIEYNAAVYAND